MTRALVIRQKEEAVSLSKLLILKGIDVCLCPLFEPLFLPLPFLKDLQGLIITSKNALRALKEREDLRLFPLYVVGDQTAQFAKEMGFLKVFSASGTSKELIDLICCQASCEEGELWHFSGESVKGNIVETLQERGFRAKRHIVYSLQEIKKLPLSLWCELQHQRISHILFFSPRTTDLFVTLLTKNKLEKTTKGITSLCFSQDVLKKAMNLEWKKIWVSPTPTTQGMIGYFDEK